jgi:periplasmic protein TonB
VNASLLLSCAGPDFPPPGRPDRADRLTRPSRRLAGFCLSACLHLGVAACLLAALLGSGTGSAPGGGGGMGGAGGGGRSGGDGQADLCLVRLELYRGCPAAAPAGQPDSAAQPPAEATLAEPQAQAETAIALAAPDATQKPHPVPAPKMPARPAQAAKPKEAGGIVAANAEAAGIAGDVADKAAGKKDASAADSPGAPGFRGLPGTPGQGEGQGGGIGPGEGAGQGPGSGTGQGDGTYSLAEVDQHPRLVSRVEPRYPESARKLSLGGKILARFLVDETGAVHSPSVASATPPGVFEESVIEAVSHWRFEPAKLRGRPVKVWATAPVRFEITGR